MITMWTASSTVYNPVIEVYVALHCNVMAYRVSSMTMQGTSDYIACVWQALEREGVGNKGARPRARAPHTLSRAQIPPSPSPFNVGHAG